MIIIMLTDREKEIHKFIDTIISEKEWNVNKNKKIKDITNKYSKELDKYKYIKSIKELNKLKLGGYIKYVNMEDELRCGGALCNIKNDNEIHIITISNIYNGEKCYYNICFEKNMIFYKNHITQEDKTRELFVSYLDKSYFDK